MPIKRLRIKNEAPRPASRDAASSPPSAKLKSAEAEDGIHTRPKNVPWSSAKEGKKDSNFGFNDSEENDLQDFGLPPDDPFSDNHKPQSQWYRNLNSNRLQLLTVLIAVLLLFLFSYWLFGKIKSNNSGNNYLLPPTPTPLQRRISTPSAYATDSAVLRVEEDLNLLEKKLLETDFNEPQLLPPVLDMNINFE